MVTLFAAGLAAVVPACTPSSRFHSPLGRVPTATVCRVDLDVEVSAGGRVESSESTEIRCTLERLDVPGQGEGASTIVELIPEGATVKEGDVLCELDASGYREEVRRQKILVERAQTDHRQAALDLDVATIELQAYSQGERLQVEKQFRGEIALGQSDLARQADRLAWARRMLTRGYSSAAQAAGEERSLKRAEVALAREVTAFRIYQRYTGPKEVLSLQSQVVGAQANLDFQSVRLKHEEERLRHHESLVDRCTVRAPHDGLVIYANKPNKTPKVYRGAPVRERLKLFYLPDLSKMEVRAMLHETVVDQVRPGMAARVRMEALPGRELEGRLVSISQIPLFDSQNTGLDVAYFLGLVQLTTQPADLRPGMTAEVKFLAGRHGVLAVPATAVAVEDGQEICYVARQDHLEWRPVKVGQVTPSLLEITGGLDEGEQVILDPPPIHAGSTRRSILH